MKILIDIMSGDKAPVEQLVGAVQAAVETPSVSFGFIGNEDIIRAVASARGLDIGSPNIEIFHTAEIVTMEDAPLCVVREKKDSSMGVGLKMLAEGKGDAFVSAGNTGALHAYREKDKGHTEVGDCHGSAFQKPDTAYRQRSEYRNFA